MLVGIRKCFFFNESKLSYSWMNFDVFSLIKVIIDHNLVGLMVFEGKNPLSILSRLRVLNY